MEKGFNKGWVDAVREQCLSDGAAPSPDGWAQIGRKMRRATARRRAALAAVVALPTAAMLLWAPWCSTVPAPSPVVQVPSPAVPTPSPAGQASIPDVPPLPITDPSLPSVTRTPAARPAAPVSSFASSLTQPLDTTTIPKTPDVPSSQTTPEEQKEPDKTVPPSKEIRKEDVNSPLLAFNEPKPRRRARFSVSLDANTSPGGLRRNINQTEQNMYYVILNRLNTQYEDFGAISKTNLSYGNYELKELLRRWAYDELEKDPSIKEWVQVEKTNWQHDLPLSFALTVQTDLTSHWALETGVEYSYLHSREKMEEYQEHRTSSLALPEHALIYMDELDQRVHFVGIPLRMTYRAWSPGRWDIYVGAGIKGEKCVKAQLGTVEYKEPHLQWSAEAFGGIQFRFLPRTHLYLQSALSWYFTKTDLITYRTENPLGLSLHAGLRFDL